jgi:hypothetical protein
VRGRRAIVVGLACLAGSLATAGAAQATTCSSASTPALKFEVVSDGASRGVSLTSTEKGFTASAMFPAALQVIRGGQTIQKTLTSRSSQYVYKPTKGEQVRFLALYNEDSSGYGATQFGVGLGQIAPIALPPIVGTLLALPAVITVQVPFPATPVGFPTGFNPSLCTRSLGAVVAEKARASRSRRSHAARFRVIRRH